MEDAVNKKDDDPKREFKDTQQEVMLELKMKTDEFLKKLKENQKKNKVHFGRM